VLIHINEQNIQLINNPHFREYVTTYLGIFQEFINQVECFGLDFEDNTSIQDEKNEILQRLKEKKALLSNNDNSIHINRISSACQACCKGTGSATFSISLMCHRNCYYCFNSNQDDYALYSRQKKDWLTELQNTMKRQPHLTHLALTGGEPLLHPNETLEFFRFIQNNLFSVHTRLYTSGDLLDELLLEKLASAGLQEIRFSLKGEDPSELQESIMEKIAMARSYIPSVMVEMPVIPDTFEKMKNVLLELDRLNIFGINLLEFCFPYTNSSEFRKRGFQLKYPPFQVLYNYWYSGGLAVSQSELLCLKLLELALDSKLKLGIHYCSLANKHIGQIYQQNTSIANFHDLMILSSRDYFLKTAKVFGADIPKALKTFKKQKMNRYYLNRDDEFLQFHPKDIPLLKKLPLEIGISYNVMETREGDSYHRELKVDLTTPKDFDFNDL